MDKIESEMIRNDLNMVFIRSNSISGLMFGCVKVYLKYKKEEIGEKEFSNILKEFNNCKDLEFVLNLFNNNGGRLDSFIKHNIYSISQYTIPKDREEYNFESDE